MIGVGDVAPDFAFRTHDGSSRTLASLRGQRVLVYFFPRANTTGCTIETRGFAERYADFRRAGVEVIGVSVDSGDTQAAFATKCGSEFPMVGDSSKEIARAYGVLGFLGVSKRVTFFLDAELRVQRIVDGMLPNPHLRAAEEWASQAGPSERPG